MAARFLFVLVLAASPSSLAGEPPRAPLIPRVEKKILASDGEAHDSFGSSVAISGDTALVATYLANATGTASGAVYVFVRCNDVWSEQAKLIASDGEAFDHFGTSVAISGDTALVGAPEDDDNGTDSGSVYVFVRSNGVWTEHAKLLASDGDTRDYFGYSVSLFGDTVLIGAPTDDAGGTASGSAYVFVRDGEDWTQRAKLLATQGLPGDVFGASVSLSGSIALIGAFGDDGSGTDSGTAYVFERDQGLWHQRAELRPHDLEGGEWFGTSVSLSGGTALIGAPVDDDNGYLAGAAYVFERSDGWEQQAKLVASAPEAYDLLGWSVSLSGDHALVGRGSNGESVERAVLFERQGGVWSERLTLMASDAEASISFGLAVSLSGRTALLGAPTESTSGVHAGAAYVFETSQRPERIALYATDGGMGDAFGQSVSFSGSTALVGAPGDDVAGAAYVFERSDGRWTERAKLVPSDGESGDSFGTSVAIWGDTALVGAPNNGPDGAAYVFVRSGDAWTEWAKLVPSEASNGSDFGASVALSGDTALVGAPLDSNDGSAFAYVRRGHTWIEEAKLVVPGPFVEHFGAAVSVDGDTALIGAYRNNESAIDSGAAYVFTRTGTTWLEQAKLLASDGQQSDHFGRSTSVAGDTAAIGATGDDFGGSAYVFARSGGGWTEQVKLRASDAEIGAQFGLSVGVSGNRVLVGAPYSGISGAAYVFVTCGTTWTELARLAPRDEGMSSSFGRAVALSGKTALVGSPSDTGNEIDSGLTYLFER